MICCENRDLVVQAAESIPGWMSRRELAWLYDCARSLGDPARWVELGAWKGRSYFCVGCALPAKSTLVAVDTFGGSMGEEVYWEATITPNWLYHHFCAVKTALEELDRGIECVIYRQDTTEACALFDSRTLDVVFIDAAHDYESVQRDIERWLPKVKSGGLLCGHDYGSW